MQWRRTLNAGLTRATGYRLVAAERRPAKPRNRAKQREYDDEARRTMQSVEPRTMTSSEKLFALILATRHVVDHRIPGAIVECGVWRGGSMQAVARTLLARGAPDRELHLFDTFEGMPAPTDKDRRHDGRPASEVLARKPKTGVWWAVASVEDVQAGMVEQTIPAQAPDRIALLRLDTDWYESTRHELEHLYDRVPSRRIAVKP